MTQQPTYGPHNPHPLSQMRTELVWEGKYDEYGNRREVDIAGCAMPMQKIESIDEPRRAAAATGQLELFEQQNPRVDDFRNRLIWGDNKLVMASLLQEFKGKVDLIYIDPPFDVGADFSMQVQIGDEKEDIAKDQSTLEMVAYRDMWGKGTDSYLHMMYDRLVLIRELLSETGSVYVHCDWRVIHLLKMLLDDVFGIESYRNDTRYIWNPQYKSYDEKYIKSKFKPDSNGRFYRIDNIGDYSDKSIAEFRKQGKIYDYPSGKIGLIRYRDEAKGEVITDIWLDINEVNSQALEDTYYATQKPEALLERIIQASSNEGDLVAGFFCVRKGTQVWRVGRSSPPVVPPRTGAQDTGSNSDSNSLPVCGEGWGGANCTEEREATPALVPIETIQPGDFVLAHDGKAHRVLRTIHRPYQGQMIGLRHSRTEATLWLTADHKVLAKTAPRTLGGNCDWSGIPRHMRGRSRELRQNMTPPERKLWGALRNNQLGVSFRRQHPIGPYIADFYSRDAHLVVEVDGEIAHSSPEAIAHDANRDAYLRSLGLRTMRIPAKEVMTNLEGVAAWIQTTSAEQFSPQGAEWIAASDLKAGDLVFWGSTLEGVRLTNVVTTSSIEEVYDLEVEAAHSYLTEVCAIHNCGSGTTGAVAERLGRKWLMCDLLGYIINNTYSSGCRAVGAQVVDV